MSTQKILVQIHSRENKKVPYRVLVEQYRKKTKV